MVSFGKFLLVGCENKVKKSIEFFETYLTIVAYSPTVSYLF